MTENKGEYVFQTYNGMMFILNKKNKMIKKDIINNIFRKNKINFTINSMSLYKIAMTHKSYCITSVDLSDIIRRVRDDKLVMKYDGDYNKMYKIIELINETMKENYIPIQEQSYERLEYLGDSIIHAIITEYIYRRYPEEHEGFMTKLRTKLENSDTLARFTTIIGLTDYILLSNEYEDANGRDENTHVLEDVFEAFIGALYLDHKDDGQNNYNICKALVLKLIEDEIDFSALNSNETNYKDQLLQYAHKKRWPDPIYGSRNISGKDIKQFVMFVKINGEIVGLGKGNSKKKGEQEAAREALRKFGAIHDDSDESEDEYIYKDDDVIIND